MDVDRTRSARCDGFSEGTAGMRLLMSRRSAVRLFAVGTGLVWARHAVAQGAARAGSPDPAHRVNIDVPIVADDPVEVPLAVSVEHPMEPDHYVKSLEVVLPTDPVPNKGAFRFTPQNGRASVAYQIRSGRGGDLVAVAECSRHGRFETHQPIRVAPGGCGVSPGTVLQEQGGHPVLRPGGRVKPGELVPVLAGLRHSSHTGLIERGGKLVQERPPFFVEHMTVFLDEEPVSEFSMTPAVSPDPQIRFFVKADRGQVLRVLFINSHGQRWEAAQRLG
jgi:sulfur-oxidizing protein SoxY